VTNNLPVLASVGLRFRDFMRTISSGISHLDFLKANISNKELPKKTISRWYERQI
jgi:hypothetical protein